MDINNHSIPQRMLESQIQNAYDRLLVTTRPRDQLRLLDKLRWLLRQRQRECSTELLNVLQ